MASLIHRKLGELPANHPLKGSRIIFGQRPPASSSNPPSQQLQETSIPLSGIDPVTEHLLKVGLPVTRENWIRASGLEEPLDQEHEALLEEALQTSGFTSLPESMDKAVQEVEAWGQKKFGGK